MRGLDWEEFEKSLDLTPQQRQEIQIECDIIKATIEAREKNKITQRELSNKIGVKQPVIARIERQVNSPTITTLIKMLYPLGYTIRVVPLDEKELLPEKQ